MKNFTKAKIMLTFCLMLGITFPAFAADSTQVTLTGTAVQPDIDLKGSDLLNAGNVNASNINTNEATATGTVSANAVSAPSGTIINLDTNRTYVRRSPTATVDAVNKGYVDANVMALLDRIKVLESQAGSSGYGTMYTNAIPTSRTIRQTATAVNGTRPNPDLYYIPSSVLNSPTYECPSGYTMSVSQQQTYPRQNQAAQVTWGRCMKTVLPAQQPFRLITGYGYNIPGPGDK